MQYMKVYDMYKDNNNGILTTREVLAEGINWRASGEEEAATKTTVKAIIKKIHISAEKRSISDKKNERPSEMIEFS